VVAGDSVVDVTDVVKDIARIGPQDVMRGVIERFDALKGRLADAVAKGKHKPVSQVRFRPPLPRPENIVIGEPSLNSRFFKPIEMHCCSWPGRQHKDAWGLRSEHHLGAIDRMTVR
jgi:hypothetical protein